MNSKPWIVCALVAILLLVSACGQQATPPAPTAAPAAAPAGTPAAAPAKPTAAPAAQPAPAKPEGTLVVAVSSLYEENFLPHTGSITGQEYRHPLYDTPFYLKHDTWEPIPGLVTKWELSPDALTWTFTVRQGVKFSNGDDLTAEDIKYTFDLVMSKESQTPRAPQYRTNIKSVDVVEPYLLKVNLNKPMWGFIEELAQGQAAMLGVVSKKYVEKVGLKEADSKPIASGPYKLVEHKRGEYVKYEAVETHWRVVPEFKTLIIRAVPEEATRVAMLQTGEADLAAVGASSAETIKKAGLTLKTIPGAYSTFATMGGPWEQGHPFYKPGVPWAKKEVREALSIAINRDELAEHVYRGFAKPVGHFLLSPGWKDLKPYAFDPEKARKLLAQAGYPNGFEVKAMTWKASPGAELPLLGEAVASYWQKIGVKVNVAPMDFAAILPDIRKGNTAGAIWFHRLTTYADYESTLNLTHATDAGGNFQIWHDDTLPKMLGDLAKITDPKAREAKMKQIAQYNYDNYSVVPLTVVDSLFAMSKKVGNWPALEGGYSINLEYITQATPRGTFRLFTP